MIVMKFGGTSVEDAAAIERVCGIIRGRTQHAHTAVVVSALGGVTDELVAISAEAAHANSAAAHQRVRRLTARHLKVTRALLGRNAAPVANVLRGLFAELARLVDKASGVRRLSPRATDELLSFGERC